MYNYSVFFLVCFVWCWLAFVVKICGGDEGQVTFLEAGEQND